MRSWFWCVVFFFNDTATTEIYTLSLHDALPISRDPKRKRSTLSSPAEIEGFISRLEARVAPAEKAAREAWWRLATTRSEEHTSELQSRQYLVCRLLLEKKKQAWRT